MGGLILFFSMLLTGNPTILHNLVVRISAFHQGYPNFAFPEIASFADSPGSKERVQCTLAESPGVGKSWAPLERAGPHLIPARARASGGARVRGPRGVAHELGANSRRCSSARSINLKHLLN